MRCASRAMAATIAAVSGSTSRDAGSNEDLLVELLDGSALRDVGRAASRVEWRSPASCILRSYPRSPHVELPGHGAEQLAEELAEPVRRAPARGGVCEGSRYAASCRALRPLAFSRLSAIFGRPAGRAQQRGSGG